MLLADFYHQEKIQTIDENNFEVQIRLNENHDIFKGHFPNNPITPGVCMIQIFKNICSEIIGKPIVLAESKFIKFTAIINPEVNPNLRLTIQLEPKEDHFLAKCTVFFEDTLALNMSVKYAIVSAPSKSL